MLDLNLFREILSIDSTSGQEQELMEFLREKMAGQAGPDVIPGLTGNPAHLLLSWGAPRVVFCTHIDTVPPCIPPTFHREDGTPCPPEEAAVVRGRGTCDAKGQLLSLLTACRELAAEGQSGFGLLIVTGEETGSFGAKDFAKTPFRAPYLIIGEPTENKMISASKGTKSYDLRFRGEAFHSGYPEYGVSAVDLFNDFCNRLRAHDFGTDPLLGKTTWNVGLLRSDNPQNILSPELTCRLYFRTTFVSDRAVEDWMAGQGGTVIPGPTGNLTVTPRGGDTPAHYMTLPGFETTPASFGSDAPHLTNFTHKIICGPGSIRYAHRDDEHILVRDIEIAVEQYKKMFRKIQSITDQ